MRKNAPIIVAFALLVLLYGLSQYWNQNRSAKFEAVLLDFLPDEITRIDLQRADDLAFSIRLNDGRWLMSKANVHETVKKSAVEELLKRLRSIRTAEIVADTPKQWEEYGVDNEQGVKVCLYKTADEPVCLRLGRYAYTEQAKRISAYTRIEGQEEVYAINGMSISLLDGNPDFFRNKQLVELNSELRKMRWRQQGQEVFLFQENNLWTTENGEQAIDSLLWKTYTKNLQSIEGQYFADDIDETTLTEKIDWSLTLFTAQDSVQINCYRDSSRQEVFVLHSQQFPQTWLSSDSTGIHQELVDPWLKTFGTARNIINHPNE